ncbi:FecR family protein [Deltaproteobacteria bacterium TL4]
MRKINLFVIAMICAGVAWAASDSVGMLTPLGESGEVFIGNQVIATAMPVRKTDVIRTGAGSFAKLVMKNGDRFNLGSNTVISVEDYSESDQNQESKSVFQVIIGKLRALVEREDMEKLLIKTGNAMVGVKGTDFIVEVPSREVTQVTTLTGIVSLRRMDAPSVTDGILINAGFRSILFQKHLPFTPIAISRKDHQQIRQTFQLRKEKALPAKPFEIDVLDDVLMREIQRRMIQEELHKQAILGLDLHF